MRKILCCFFVAIFCSAVWLIAAPTPGGKASIKYGLPSGVNSPTIDRVPSISKPYPTNKWFTSLIHATTVQNRKRASLAMYTYPLLYTISGTTGGLIIGCPYLNVCNKCFTFSSDVNENNHFRNQLSVLPYKNSTIENVQIDKIKLDSFSDWCCKINFDDYYTATIGQGMLFSYYDFSKQSYNATINYVNSCSTFTVYNYDDLNNPIADNSSFTGDRFVIEVRTNYREAWDGYQVRVPSSTVYYGVFLSSSQTSIEKTSSGVKINFVDDDSRYMSIALMKSKEDLQKFYPYAYNFVKNTQANTTIKNNVVETKFNFSFDTKRTTSETISNETIFAVMPHHYKNNKGAITYFDNTEFQTLRGKMKLAKGGSFTTRYNTLGIVPFFQYDTKEIKTNLATYLTEDNGGVNVSSVSQNPYRAGKIIAKLANMLPVADNINNSILKDSLKIKLKALLEDWFIYRDGEQSKYFAYDTTWGGLFGVKDDEFGSHLYNDHHFHFGYFIYSAAILAMYDDSFAKDYGQMVELLIKDIANTDRSDTNFPYMRHFDIYEGHSWANGMGGEEIKDPKSNSIYSDSINEESSSEAMNAWSAIYLWGLATQQQKYIDLGLSLYTIHYNSLRDYYLDIDATKIDDSERIYPKVMMEGYYGNHGSIGILFGGRASYSVWWESDTDPQTKTSRTIKGIQVLPLTPAMTYLAYDKEYARKFYLQMESETPNDYYWNDIWTRFRALFEPQNALTSFINNPEIDEGGSKSFTYHFINFFNKYGTPNFTYTADVPSYMVLEKNNIKTYCAYNPGDSSKNIHFYDSLGEDLGYLVVGAKSFSSSSNLIKGGENKKISVYPVPYKPQSGGKYDANGISFLGVANGDNIKIFNVAGEKVFEETVSITDNLFVWNSKNNAGKEVASGIYFYYIKTTDGKKIKGKLAIER